MEEKIQLDTSPDPDVTRAFMDSVDTYDAVFELIDNIIDTARIRDTGVVNIEIVYTEEGTEKDEWKNQITIKDDAGGVKPGRNGENLAKLVQLGNTGRVGNQDSIGIYGVGMKRGIKSLGESAIIETRHVSEEKTARIEMPESALLGDEWDTVTAMPIDSLEGGKTAIKIGNLEDSFDLNRLKQKVEDTYDRYLSGDKDVNVNLKINEQDIDVPDSNPWSYNPFAPPRRYPNIKVGEDDKERPIYATITVGLLANNDVDAGTDIYCQGRKVVSALRDEKGGFDSDHLGNWQAKYSDFKLILELHTDGDRKDLPWTSSKNQIEMNGVLFEALDWVKRIGYPYTRHHYDNLPRTEYVNPYSSESDYAYNDGNVKEYEQYLDNYKNIRQGEKQSRNVSDKMNLVKNKAKKHVILGITGIDTEIRKYVPTYRALIEKYGQEDQLKYDGTTYDIDWFDDLEEVDEVPPPNFDLDEVISEIENIASEPDEEWKVPKYRSEFDQMTRIGSGNGEDGSDSITENQDDSEENDSEENDKDETEKDQDNPDKEVQDEDEDESDTENSDPIITEQGSTEEESQDENDNLIEGDQEIMVKIPETIARDILKDYEVDDISDLRSAFRNLLKRDPDIVIDNIK